jgi:hypothetical protein
VLLILRLPHSSILMCYWFSCDFSMLEWGNLRFNYTSVCWNEVTWESIIHQCAGMVKGPMRINNTLVWKYKVLKRNGEKMKTHYKSQQQKTTTYHWTKMENTKVLLILMGPFTMPAHWCIIDSQVTSFQHTDVLWFSCYLILAYRCVIDSHVTSF